MALFNAGYCRSVMQHSAMTRYSQPVRYLAHSASFAAGRAAFFLSVAFFALSLFYGEAGASGRVPAPVLLAVSFALGGLWIVGVGAATLIALSLRCDACSKRQVWTSLQSPPAAGPATGRALKRLLGVEEIVDRRFQCCHCGVEYSLRSGARGA